MIELTVDSNYHQNFQDLFLVVQDDIKIVRVQVAQRTTFPTFIGTLEPTSSAEEPTDNNICVRDLFQEGREEGLELQRKSNQDGKDNGVTVHAEDHLFCESMFRFNKHITTKSIRGKS